MSSESESVRKEVISAAGDIGSVSASRVTEIRSRDSLFLPASEFNGYECSVPGSGQQILNILSEQMRHRMEIEKSEMAYRHSLGTKIVDNDDKVRNMQIGCGMVAFLFLLALSALFAFLGMEYAAIAAFALPTMQGAAMLLQSWNGKNQKSGI